VVICHRIFGLPTTAYAYRLRLLLSEELEAFYHQHQQVWNIFDLIQRANHNLLTILEDDDRAYGNDA
jgi:hypothetical protein